MAEGPIDTADYEAWSVSPVGVAGLPRLRESRLDAAYPFATVSLTDADLPVTVRVQAFNPFVPTGADASGLPAAVVRFVCHNHTDEAVESSLCGAIDNITGASGVTAREAGQQPTSPRPGPSIAALHMPPGSSTVRPTGRWTRTPRAAWRSSSSTRGR